MASASSLAFGLLIPFFLNLMNVFYAFTRFFNWFWAVFVIAYVVVSYIHHKAQGFSLTRYDFDKFSLNEGQFILPWEKLVSKLNMNKRLTPIFIECVLEPLVIFIISIVFIIIPFSRSVGVVLLLSSIIYSISYIAAYWRSRNDILDRNDERIMNEDMAEVFMGDVEIPDLPENTRIQLPPIMPEKKEHKEEIYKQIMVDTVAAR